MKHLILATALLIFSVESLAFIPKHRISPEIKITENFLIIEDTKTQQEWKIDTNCDLDLTENMVVKSKGTLIKENSRLHIESAKSSQLCRVTNMSKM